MKKRTRSEIIYEVALGGISTAIALLLVWLSVVVPYGTIALYVCASIALIVPLTQKYYFATAFAYIVSSLLAFAIVGDILLISGFVVYFAPMTIMSGVMIEKKVKWLISIPVKVVYIGLALAFLFYVAGTIMISDKIVEEVPFWAVELVGIVVLLLVDFLMGYVYGAIKTKVSKVIRKKTDNDENRDDDEDAMHFDSPFDFDENPQSEVDNDSQLVIDNDGQIDVDNDGDNEVEENAENDNKESL